MNDKTRYAYEKRIKELEAEVSHLKHLRMILSNIVHAAKETKDGESLRTTWILSQLIDLLYVRKI